MTTSANRSARSQVINFLFFLTASLAPSTAGFSQGHSGVEQLSYVRTAWDFAYDVAVRDGLVYLATGRSGLQVLNIARPDAPTFIGLWQDTSISLTQVSIAQDHVYACAGSQGMAILDVTFPQRPRLERLWRAYDVVYDVKVQGNFAFLAAFRQGLRILDIHDPVEPEEIARIDTASELRGVFIANNYAYLADGRAGLIIVDVNDPTTPNLIGACDVGGTVDHAFAQGNLAYLISGAIGMVVVDVSDPSAPQVLSRFPLDQIPYDIEVRDTLAFITYSNDVRILDVAHPRQPTDLGFIDTTPPLDPIRGISFEGNIVCMAAGLGGFYTADVSDIQWYMRTLGKFNCKGTVRNLVVADTLLYASKVEDGMMVMDMAQPAGPYIVTFLRDKIWDLKVAGNYAFYAGESSFHVADLTNPTDPRSIVNLQGSGSNRGLFLDGQRAYTCGINGGLRVYDISNPEQATQLGQSGVSGYHYDFVAAEGIGYLADSNNGMHVMNVADPTNPTEISRISIHPQSHGWGLWLTDTLLFYADGDAGLIVYNITARDNPVEIARFDPEAPIKDVVIDGTHAYLAAGESGLLVLDISDPNQMHLAGYYDTPGDAQGIFLDREHNLIYIADGEGIGVYDATQALQINTSQQERVNLTIPLFSVFPNPSNARFNFILESSAPNKTLLAIYDNGGRQVYCMQAPGENKVISWDALNAPAGIYFARMKGASSSTAIQIILQK